MRGPINFDVMTSYVVGCMSGHKMVCEVIVAVIFQTQQMYGSTSVATQMEKDVIRIKVLLCLRYKTQPGHCHYL